MRKQKFDIRRIIDELKDTVQTIDEYLIKKGWSNYKAEIEKAIYNQHEITQCVNCDSWQELGEFNSDGECQGCNSQEK